jgi:glycosyltransferase involved in cell wall biosynthesis
VRIAFITSELAVGEGFTGGLANYVARTAMALVQLGHEVEVFTIGEKDSDFDWQGMRVHFVSGLLDSKTRFRDKVDRIFQGAFYGAYQEAKRAWCLWRRYRRVVLEERRAFDVVQVANVQGVGLFFKSLAGELLVTRHSNYRPLWDRSIGIPDSFSQTLRWWVEKKAVARTAVHYAPSQFVASQVARHYDLPKVDVVETPFFQEVVQTAPGFYERHLAGKRYFLFFGRLTQMKGVHRLAEALPSVLEKLPNLQVAIVGSDTKVAPTGGSMREYIRNRVGERFLERVHLFEALPHEELYPVIEGAEWVVLPSVVDNLPNTCLEAMGHGRPVVATLGNCFEQLIEDGLTGLLCKADCAESLATKLNEAAEMDEAARERLAAKGKESLRRLNPENAIPALIKYFESWKTRTATFR